LAQDFCSSSRRSNRRIAGYATVTTTKKTGKKTGQLFKLFRARSLACEKEKMDKQEVLANIFKQLLSGNIPLIEIQHLASAISEKDITWMMEQIEFLNDPSDNFTGKEKGDETAVSGFFLFIDLVSVLIISVGEKARLKLHIYRNSSNMYTPWVHKYVLDTRFHEELLKKFGL
jgi:hypothetical protein